MSAFEHERFLQGVIKSLGSGDTKIVDRLSELQRYIANGTGGFWTFTFSSGQREKNMRFIDNLAQDWQDCFGRFLEQAGGDTSSHDGGLPAYPFPCLRHSQFLNVPHPLNIQVIMPTLQAAVMRICCESCAFTPPTPDRPFDKQLADLPGIDYYALELLVSVLQRTGGPLFNAIRSKGLGYTPSFKQNMWSGMLVFEVYQTPDASMAILEMQALVSGVGKHWDKYVTEFEIAMAKSEMVCRATGSECSPYLQTFYCYVSSILGFASASQYTVWKNAHISAVENADLRRAYDLYLKRFVTPGHPLLTVVLTPPGTEISAELGKFEVKTLDEL
ncbi:hypothetical protein EC988_004017 [Linderina pennispora]|nr:hypothetical protein EC988_004017 [Linderina pennispora]